MTIATSSRATRSRAAAWLRVYLGYAPDVGKTFAMLQEGRELQRRGSDVVIGWVETYNRVVRDVLRGTRNVDIHVVRRPSG